MEYQTTKIDVQSEPPSLILTRQEAKCAESLSDLVVGDRVIVIYMGSVFPARAAGIVNSVGVFLDQPIIVKQTAFSTFAERFMDFLSENTAQTQTQPQSGSVGHYST